MLKNRLIIFLMILTLVCPIATPSASVYAEPADAIATTSDTEEIRQNKLDDEEVSLQTENVKNEEFLPKNDTFKQPISKKKIAKKFLLAMFGVAISSFLVFFVLTLYNRVRYRITNKVKTPDGETPLKEPDSISEAVQIFLNKTQWK